MHTNRHILYGFFLLKKVQISKIRDMAYNKLIEAKIEDKFFLTWNITEKMPKYYDRDIRECLNMFLEQHKDIVMYKLSGTLVCNWILGN